VLPSNLYLKVTFWDKEKVVLNDRWPLKSGSVHMKFSLTGQDKGGNIAQ
jgi:hypothetical protein